MDMNHLSAFRLVAKLDRTRFFWLPLSRRLRRDPDSFASSPVHWAREDIDARSWES